MFLNGSVNIFDTWDSGFIEMRGGQINDIDIREYGEAKIYDGFLSEIRSRDKGKISFYGGNLGSDLQADGSSIFTIYGSDFKVDSIPIGYGELTSILGGDSWDDPTRHISGTLLNGDLLDNNFYIGHDAKIILVPEPASILLLGLSAFILNKRKTV